MSYVYPLYNYLANFPQGLYPVYTQNTFQNMFQPIVFSNTHGGTQLPKIPSKFDPILLSTQTSI